jgi:hypothetical protein
MVTFNIHDLTANIVTTASVFIPANLVTYAIDQTLSKIATEFFELKEQENSTVFKAIKVVSILSATAVAFYLSPQIALIEFTKRQCFEWLALNLALGYSIHKLSEKYQNLCKQDPKEHHIITCTFLNIIQTIEEKRPNVDLSPLGLFIINLGAKGKLSFRALIIINTARLLLKKLGIPDPIEKKIAEFKTEFQRVNAEFKTEFETVISELKAVSERKTAFEKAIPEVKAVFKRAIPEVKAIFKRETAKLQAQAASALYG